MRGDDALVILEIFVYSLRMVVDAAGDLLSQETLVMQHQHSPLVRPGTTQVEDRASVGHDFPGVGRVVPLNPAANSGL